MDTHARTHPDALPAPAWNAYLQEARFEFLRLWRSPSFSLPVLLFPPLFYLLFGEIFGGNRSPEAARYLLAGCRTTPRRSPTAPARSTSASCARAIWCFSTR